MKNRILTLAVIICLLLFSIPGLSQTTEKSNHPLLDKYYPQKQNPDTNTNAITQTQPQSNPAPITKPVPQQKFVTPAVADTTTIQSAKRALSVTKTNPEPEPTAISLSQPEPTSKSVVPIADTNSINRQKVTIAPSLPVQVHPQTQQRPASKPYIDTRLGSSSPLYNTYEKNNYGAGSVTTSPK